MEPVCEPERRPSRAAWAQATRPDADVVSRPNAAVSRRCRVARDFRFARRGVLDQRSNASSPRNSAERRFSRQHARPIHRIETRLVREAPPARALRRGVRGVRRVRLRPAGGREDHVRPGERLPPQPEHPHEAGRDYVERCALSHEGFPPTALSAAGRRSPPPAAATRRHSRRARRSARARSTRRRARRSGRGPHAGGRRCRAAPTSARS